MDIIGTAGLPLLPAHRCRNTSSASASRSLADALVQISAVKSGPDSANILCSWSGDIGTRLSPLRIR